MAAKQRVRSISGSPVVQAMLHRRAQWLLLLPAFLMFRNVQTLGWIVVAVMFVGLLALEVSLLCGVGHRGFVRVMKHLRDELPWFDGAAITWLHDDQLGSLRAAIANGVVVHEIEGAGIRSANDFAAALERHLGKRTFPGDPIAKSIAILLKAGIEPRRTHVLVWSNANVMAAADPEGFTKFVSSWTSSMTLGTPHVLVFLSRPRAVVTAASAPFEAVVAPTASATDAWWQPTPGELTH